MSSWVFDGRRESIDRLRGHEVPSAHRQLEAVLDTAAGTEETRPSRLDGWTLGHLVAHLRLNAESHIRVLVAARSGQLVDQYPGGSPGRAEAIERNSTRPFSDLVEGLCRAHIELEHVWDSLSAVDWHRPTQMRAGHRPAFVSLWARWRETCLHTVDLDLGYTSDRWSEAFSTAALDVNIGGLELRPLSERLEQGVVVQLSNGPRTWTSQPDRPATHHASGRAQSLLGWIVQRPAVDAPVWDTEPGLDPWP